MCEEHISIHNLIRGMSYELCRYHYLGIYIGVTYFSLKFIGSSQKKI